jgi:hypothetical protein
MSFKRLKKEEITLNLHEGNDGELVISVGMYGKEKWMHWFPIRLKNFPKTCKSLNDFDFTINGRKR